MVEGSTIGTPSKGGAMAKDKGQKSVKKPASQSLKEKRAAKREKAMEANALLTKRK